MNSHEAKNEVDSVFILMMQNRDRFDELAKIADTHNYLFRLANLSIERCTANIAGSSTQSMLDIGVRSCQAIKLFADPPTSDFVTLPHSAVAEKVIIDTVAGIDDYELIELGESHIDGMFKFYPEVTSAAEEVIDRYSRSKGDRTIAMAGVALMGYIVDRAELQLRRRSERDESFS